MRYEPHAPQTVTRAEADQENARWLRDRRLKNHIRNLMKRRYEDSLSVTELLERRA
jgi:hypothetical protein